MASARLHTARADVSSARLPAPTVPLSELIDAFGAQEDRKRGRDAPSATAPERAQSDAEASQWQDKLARASLEKADLLALMLGQFMPVAAAQRHAETLLARHGTLGGVVAASSERLTDQLQNADAAAFIKVLRALATELVREPITERPLIDSPSALNAYLRASLRHESVECVRLMFLNGSNRLITEEVHSQGTINHCPLYPREVVRRVIEMNANALIVIHNHPSGDPAPSPQDAEMTQHLAQTLSRIGVSLHDHVIAGANGNFSFRAHKLLELS